MWHYPFKIQPGGGSEIRQNITSWAGRKNPKVWIPSETELTGFGRCLIRKIGKVRIKWDSVTRRPVYPGHMPRWTGLTGDLPDGISCSEHKKGAWLLLGRMNGWAWVGKEEMVRKLEQLIRFSRHQNRQWLSMRYLTLTDTQDTWANHASRPHQLFLCIEMSVTVILLFGIMISHKQTQGILRSCDDLADPSQQ